MQACEELLPLHGYVGLTTQLIADRAGVSIASLYEYFHTKDAIVAEVIDRSVERIFGTYRATLLEAYERPLDEMLRFWIGVLYAEAKRHEALVSAGVFTVPFVMQVRSVKRSTALVTELVKQGYARRPYASKRLSTESLYLMEAMAAGTILSLVFLRPDGADHDAILVALANRVQRWSD